MNTIETLGKKIRLAVEQLGSLKAANKKLQDEVLFLHRENQKLKELSESSASWIGEKRQISNRIEKVLKKINSMGIPH